MFQGRSKVSTSLLVEPFATSEKRFAVFSILRAKIYRGKKTGQRSLRNGRARQRRTKRPLFRQRVVEELAPCKDLEVLSSTARIAHTFQLYFFCTEYYKCTSEVQKSSILHGIIHSFHSAQATGLPLGKWYGLESHEKLLLKKF